MYFTHEEKVAVSKLGKLMILADGKLDAREMAIFASEIGRFIGSENIESILNECDAMEPSRACSIVAQMTGEEKRYICSLLATIMAADLDINDKENTLWVFVSTICKFPTMTIQEGVEYMARLQ